MGCSARDLADCVRDFPSRWSINAKPRIVGSSVFRRAPLNGAFVGFVVFGICLFDVYLALKRVEKDKAGRITPAL